MFRRALHLSSAILPALAVTAALSISSTGALAAHPASARAKDQCGTPVMGMHIADGPFFHNSTVVKGNMTLSLQTYPGHKPKPGHPGVDQLSFIAPHNFAWNALVHVYVHGNLQHACGAGYAVHNYQTKPSYSRFMLQATVKPMRMWVHLQIGKRIFTLAGTPRH